jgi:hypothetical protein
MTVERAGYAYPWVKELGNAGHRRPGPMRLADPSAVLASIPSAGGLA